jgi:uncharacterized protein (TIGR03790 family)
MAFPTSFHFRRVIAYIWIILFFMFHPASAKTLDLSIPILNPAEVAVVANFSYPHSEELARHYSGVRGIPETQLLVTGMPKDEVISRREYEQYISGPVKDFLVDENMDHVRCIVLMYGTPLRVKEPPETLEQKELQRMCVVEMLELRRSINRIRQELYGLIEGNDAEPPGDLPEFNMDKKLENKSREMKNLLGEDMRAVYRWLLEDPESESLKRKWMLLWISMYGFTRPSARDFPDPPEHPAYVNNRLTTGSMQLFRRRGELIDKMNTADGFDEAVRELIPVSGLVRVMNFCVLVRQMAISDWESSASVDSELSALFWPPYYLKRRYPNPLHMERLKSGRGEHHRTLMVARLDGPDNESVRRMIGDCIETGKAGLSGRVYLDARGREGNDSYGKYDRDIVKLAGLIDRHTTLSVTLDEQDELFKPGDCPETAIYCGWYSLGKYRDAFDFQPGSVGFHIASNEAVSLKKKGSQLWCPRILKDGCAATLGPVAEPYLDAFPLPSQFFGLLMTGKLPLVECYYRSLPDISWMMTLIGDPLYNPFRMNPMIHVETVIRECF